MTGAVAAEVVVYTAGLRDAWNAHNRTARNGHFLFDRDFMEYHSDRFEDASLMVLRGSEVLAILPADISGESAHSHRGLTFGGLVTGEMSCSEVLHALDLCAGHYRDRGCRRLVYKVLPWIYHRSPAQDDLYWLFRREARLIRRDVTSTVDYRSRKPFSSRRRRGVKKAAAAGLVYGESVSWDAFWEVLGVVLEARHSTAPVHTIDEIKLLARRMPDAIRLFTAEEQGKVVAGTVIFETPFVAHAQYIASGERGRETGGLDGLFSHLIDIYAPTKRFFDFGISTEAGGMTLNQGLLTQKEEFGGGTAVHDTYELLL